MAASDSRFPQTRQLDDVEFRLLGPVGIWARDTFVGPATPHQRSVLAMLLLNMGRTVPLDRLMRAVWERESPPSARNAVQGYISRLRRLLAQMSDVELSTSPPGYRLSLDPARVDLLRFRDLVASAHASDPATASELLRQALGLCQGPFLADVAGAWLRDTYGATLEEERLSTVEQRIAIDLRLGRHREAVAELALLISEHPLRERLVKLMMVALCQDGRRAAALAAYRDLRGRLVEELGIDPGSELQQLHQRILEDDDLTVSAGESATVLVRHGRPAAEQQRVPLPPVPAELPAGPVSFTGRSAELARAYEMLSGDRSDGLRICQISGLGGVGKSSLALRIAHAVAGDFPDGQLYIDLHGHTPETGSVKPMEAVRRFLRSLGVADSAIPATLEEAAGRFRSLTYGKRILVVLDNARDVAQVRPLLPGSPGCAVLITSRRKLTSFEGAVQIALDVLSGGEALDLLRAMVGETTVAAEPAEAVEVIRLCGGLPLALSLAAARLRARPAWSLAILVNRLENSRRRLDELRVDDRAVRASFQTSYQDLHGDLRGRAAARMFRMLGMLDGPDVSLSAAAALADLPEERAQYLLDHLVDAQLVDNYVPNRYRLHDLLRLFARERAEEEESLQVRHLALRRLLRHYLATVRTISRKLNRGSTWRLEIGPSDLTHPDVSLETSQETRAWIAAEVDIILAAMEQAVRTPVADEVVGLAAMLAVLLHEHGLYLKQFRLSELALVAAKHTNDPLHLAVAHGDLGWAHIYTGRPDHAIRHLHRSRTAFRRAGNTSREAALLDYIGVAHRSAGRYEAAISYHLRALAHVGEAGNCLTPATVLTHLGLAYQRTGQFDSAIAAHTRTIEIYKEANISAYLGLSVAHLAEAHRLAGQSGQAIALYQEALDLHREAGPISEFRRADILWGLGRALHNAGRTTDARRYWRRSIAIMQDLNLITAEERNSLENNETPATPQVIEKQYY